MPPDASAADARFEFAIRKAEEAGDVAAWLIAVRARYDRAKARHSAPTELHELRILLRGRLDALRAASRSRMSRLWAGQVVESIVGELSRDYMKEGEIPIAELFDLIESVKSRTLLDQMCLGYKELPQTEAKRRADSIEQQIISFPPDDDSNPIHKELQLSSQLRIPERWGPLKDQQPLRELESIYSQASAGFSGVQRVCTLAEVQQMLSPQEALINYFIPDHPLHPARELHSLAVTKQGVVRFSCDLTSLDRGGKAGFIGTLIVDGKQPIQSTPLGEMVVMARMAIQRGDDRSAEAWLQRLYGLLIDPLRERGLNLEEFEKLVIVPHRLLHPIPWGALCDKNGRHLIEDVAVSLVPSASIWLKLSQRPTSPPTSFLGLGNPKPLPGKLPALPEAGAEVESIAQILDKQLQCTVLLNEKATESALQQQLRGKNLIHFATHGMFPEQNALDFHELLLGAGDGCDGRVRAEELRKMDFHAASLVVLSICNGGIYRFGPGDEPYGLMSAFLAAGATSLVGTLWSIHDRKARQFMTKYYSYLLQYGAIKSLRLTCCELAAQGWAIRDWAAFLVVGPGGPFAGS